ncbi:MAG: DUF512 domain-containing protein, partial [bacterium]
MPLKILEVQPRSPAAHARLAPGDLLLSVNSKPIRDVIDLFFHSADDRLSLRVLPRDGVERSIRIKKEEGEPLGIELEPFEVRTCNNKCVFCFIHQNPRGLRREIYFKDGDYRMSFLHGNYITGTNLSREDMERIVEQRLSPLYFSVHTTDHELRRQMLGNKTINDICEILRFLKSNEIEFHCQIVLCPGLNDGKQLEKTLRDLLDFCPALLSIAVVPLGLTAHRANLPSLPPVTSEFCRTVIKQIAPIQKEILREHGRPILFLSDEFFLRAGLRLPSYANSEVLHQLENGVGMV